MKVVLTGATGFVGSKLVSKLHDRGDSIVILARDGAKAKRLFTAAVYPNVTLVPYNATESGDWQDCLSGSDAVINLAGEPISERWTTEYKRAILESRTVGTDKVVEAIGKAEVKPGVLVSASAIGYYGTSETLSFDEDSPAGTDFLATVCEKWEASALKVKEYGTRLVIPRIGIVLGNGGALGKMLPPFKLFAGGPIGSGRQWFSWIHRDDLIDLILTCIDRPDLEGVFNATAPEPVRMKDLCRVLGEVLNRPSWLPVPDFALEMLLGEGAKVVLEGQEVLPKRTLESGFQYRFPDLKSALADIIPKM